MLNRCVTAARSAGDPPWDARRQARVLERALHARRTRRRGPLGLWVVALAGGSLVALFVQAVSGSVSWAPAGDPLPGAGSTSADALDGGKQAG